jgi:DnaJ-related protein SCJ1
MKIHVTLEDIYKGKEIGVMNTKKIICPHCRGSGADDPDHIRTCPDCNGQGMVIRRHQVGPGFWQQVQQPCDRCQGKGKIHTSTCHVCRGTKTIPGMNRFTLYIEKGVKNGQKINMPNEGSEYENMAASNLAFLIIETPHAKFRREGDNLYTTLEIDLREALLGFTKTITHLDGHKVEIRRSRVTQPGDFDRLANEGMPQFGYSSYHGELFVEYKVKLPDRLSDEGAKAWDEALKVSGI